MSADMSRTVRSLSPEVRVINKDAAEVDYIASDPSLDCYNEIVVPQGVDFSRFSKNAPFVNSHDYGDIRNLLGRVIDFRVEKGAVVERVRFAVQENDLAALAFRLTEGGYLRAVSVGFMPKRYAFAGSKEFAEMVKELKLSAELVAQCRCIHREWEQIELSACVIGANPNALVKGFQDKFIKEEELAKIGFGDDDAFEFLTLASAQFDKADDLTKALIGREMQRIHARRQFSNATQRSKPLTPAPGGGSEGKRQAEQQAAELRELVAALKRVPRVPAQA